MAEISRIAADKLQKEQVTAFTSFLDGFYSASAPDDLMEREPAELYAIAYSMWMAAPTREKGTSIVKVLNPRGQENDWNTKNTVLHIINEDMPFLVDSITGCLATTLQR